MSGATVKDECFDINTFHNLGIVVGDERHAQMLWELSYSCSERHDMRVELLSGMMINKQISDDFILSHMQYGLSITRQDIVQLLDDYRINRVQKRPN